MGGFARRFVLIFNVNKYDFIFLQREITPLGPPIFEWILCKLFKKKLIYDFDDAIWITFVSEQNSVASIFENAGKVKSICKWAYKVSCGNEYLCQYARQYSSAVIYNPTCVDTSNRHNQLANHEADRLTIVWTGSFSTMIYLKIFLPALKRLQEKYDFDVKIISNQNPALDLKNVKYVEWNEQDEVKELAACQIGLMPLHNDSWSEGKCGFKLIQYFALGIPAVSSSVGVDRQIVEHGVNGYFADSDEEWYNAIEKLINNPALRHRMGLAGKNKVLNHFSLESNQNTFLGLFT
jgi:glycosyltransferase involved in cell wall biosynthesis